MAITFEQVTADVEREPKDRGAASDSAPAEPAADIGEQLEQALRLRAERAARLCDL